MNNKNNSNEMLVVTNNKLGSISSGGGMEDNGAKQHHHSQNYNVNVSHDDGDDLAVSFSRVSLSQNPLKPTNRRFLLLFLN
jgi:hypothetical protein